jgi:hypothetical protein
MNIKVVLSSLFVLSAAAGVYSLMEETPPESVDKQANDYFPVQSDSERAAGHPLVGVS